MLETHNAHGEELLSFKICVKIKLNMIDKLKLNNLVISNKKKIQQGTTQVINKLVQKIRKLKGLLEKHPENGKHTQSLRKSTAAMMELKQLKRLDIVQNLLLFDRKPSSVLTNGLAVPAEIAIALLSTNKILQTLKTLFETELKLSAEDASWKDEILEVSKRRSKINRTEEKRQQRKDQKEQKSIAKKRIEWMQEQKEGTTATAEAASDLEQDADVADKDVATVPNAGVSKVEPMEEEAVTDAQQIKIENVQKKPTERKQMKKKPEIKAKLQKNLKEKPNRRLNETKKPKIVFESKMESAVELKLDAASAKSEYVEKNDTEPESESEPEPATTHIVDPFFITASGENYLSTAIVERDEANENGAEERMHMGGGYRKEWDAQRKMENENRRRGGGGGGFGAGNFQMDNRRGGGGGGNYKNDNRNNFQMRNNSGRNSERPTSRQAAPQQRRRTEETQRNATAAAEQRLHPSWAAKQKLKPVISSFQGTKTTFGEDDGNQGGQKSKTHGAPREKYDKNNGNSNRRTVAAKPTVGAGDSAAEKLHPSWVAKQKLKPSITAFAGKKTTFDD